MYTSHSTNLSSIEKLPYDILLYIFKIISRFPSRLIRKTWCSRPVLPPEIWNISLISKTFRDVVSVILLDTAAFVVDEKSDHATIWTVLENRLDGIMNSQMMHNTTRSV